jgi:hypothetical protein
MLRGSGSTDFSEQKSVARENLAATGRRTKVFRAIDFGFAKSMLRGSGSTDFSEQKSVAREDLGATRHGSDLGATPPGSRGCNLLPRRRWRMLFP